MEIICTFCQATNVDTKHHCYRCGQVLPIPNPLLADEMVVYQPKVASLDTDLLINLNSQQHQSTEAVHLFITEPQKNISFPLGLAIMLGRLDPIKRIFPEIDLTCSDSNKNGVSRQHAKLIGGSHHQGWIKDLHSANGTFLNGKRLVPKVYYELAQGDFLQLGKVVIQLFFGDAAQVAELRAKYLWSNRPAPYPTSYGFIPTHLQTASLAQSASASANQEESVSVSHPRSVDSYTSWFKEKIKDFTEKHFS